MISRRTLETAGFFTIAAALHVSAAAIMLPDRLERGAAAEAPPATLSAGGDEIRSMVEGWEAPPETQAAPQIANPQAQPEPEQAQPEPELALQLPPAESAPVQLAAAPLARPEPAPVQPNLPPPPQPADPDPVIPDPIDPAQLDLPKLRQLPPPIIRVASPLALESSSRPDRRPARQPKPATEPRRTAAPSTPQAPAQAPPAQRAGEGGQSQHGNAAGGGGGVSAETRASAMAQWSAQIATCIGRQFSRVTGAPGGRIVVNILMARNGRVQGATLLSGTGDARVDSQVVRTAQRLRACPAAPAAVTGPLHTFTTPFTLR